MKSKRNVLINRFAATENRFRTNSVRECARARTRGLPVVILCLLALCALPSANRAQVPVYEVTPVESTIKFDVESSVPIKGTFEKWNASLKLFVHGREERCFRHRASGRQRGHRERNEKQQIGSAC